MKYIKITSRWTKDRIVRLASRGFLIMAMLMILLAGTSFAAPPNEGGQIKVYNTWLTSKSYQWGGDIQPKWTDVSPTEYDVWYQPYADRGPNDRHAFVVEAWEKNPDQPYPATDRQGVRIVFPARDDGPMVLVHVQGKNGKEWQSVGEIYHISETKPYKTASGKTKTTRIWFDGTYTRDFRYMLTKDDDGRDKIIIEHRTGVNGKQWKDFRNHRRSIYYEITLGDWAMKIRYPEDTDIYDTRTHRHQRMHVIPGKGDGGDVVMDINKGYRSTFDVDLSTQEPYAVIVGMDYHTKYYNPKAPYLPIIGWENQGSGKCIQSAADGRYQSIGRIDPTSAEPIWIGGIPLNQGELIKKGTVVPDLPDGTYRRISHNNGQWKYDSTIQIDDKTRGADLPANVTGTEYLYVPNDLTTRVFGE